MEGIAVETAEVSKADSIDMSCMETMIPCSERPTVLAHTTPELRWKLARGQSYPKLPASCRPLRGRLIRVLRAAIFWWHLHCHISKAQWVWFAGHLEGKSVKRSFGNSGECDAPGRKLKIAGNTSLLTSETPKHSGR